MTNPPFSGKFEPMSNTRSLIIGIIVVIVLVVTAIVVIRFVLANRGNDNNNDSEEQTTENTTPSLPVGDQVQLEEQQNSGTNGIASISNAEGKVRVSLNLSEYVPDTLQSAAVFTGKCDDRGSELYPLAATFNGQSVTTLETNPDQFNSRKPLSVVVFKSQESKDIAACGNL